MYSYSLLLLTTIIASGSTTASKAIRGSRALTEDGERRRLMQQITCKLFLQPVSFDPTEENPAGFSEDTWVCELDDDEHDGVGMRFVELAHNFNEPLINATSGLSTITVSEAIIDTGSDMMYLPSDAQLTVSTGEYSDHEIRRRQLTASTGELTTLVVRIVGSEGTGPKSSVSQLRNDFFEDSVSLKTQFEACSYNKLKIKPYSDNKVTKGVYELNIDLNTENKSRKEIEKAANEAMERDFGKISQSPFDLIAYCMPPGENGNWGASAYVNGRVSMYSSEWCHKVSAQMHEVGHNINLEHSSEGEKEYGDYTGAMGVSWNEDDTKMCYNPSKNWQLGWYEDQQESHNPLTWDEATRTFTLNGVADYKENKDALVVLRLDEANKDSDYYVGYNRKIGINADTKEDGDKVTVHRKEKKPLEYGFSWKVAQLKNGESYTITNFNGKGKDVEVKFVGLVSGRDAIVEITDVDRAGPPPPPAPCTKYTVEVKTDNYPGDTSWEFTEQGGLGRSFGSSSKYTEKLTVRKDKVCLEYDTQYKFTINDKFKDGLCCQQGQGYYRLLDSDNKVVIERMQGTFETDEKIFNVGPNPDPDEPTTKAPTNKPTKAPTSDDPSDDDCLMHTVQIVTDNFPGDSSWSILKKNKEEYISTPMTKKKTEYETKVCLKEKKTYKFVMVDEYKDGLCCSQGNGSYKVIDPDGKVIIDSKNKNKEFHIKEHKFKTKKGASTEEEDDDTSTCENKKQKFKLKNSDEKRSCKQHEKDGNCNEKSKSGSKVWQLCPKACNRCDDV